MCINVATTYVSNAGFRLIVNNYPHLKVLKMNRVDVTSEMLQGCRPDIFKDLM
jgi:hypothetical protein